MKAKYDFSKGEHDNVGRNLQAHIANNNAEAVFQIPIYLEKDVDDFMQHLTASKGRDVGELVNELLRRNIRLIQSIQ